MGEALKRCPFCGSSDVGYAVGDGTPHMHVTCEACGAKGPKVGTTAENGAVWNRRTVGPGDAAESPMAPPSYWCEGCRSFHPDSTPHAASRATS